MNTGMRHTFGRSKTKNYIPNVFIGNMADVFPTPLSIHNALGVLESDIKNYQIIGNDIKFYIETNYSITQGFINSEITYFIDLSYRCKQIYNQSFENTKIRNLIAPEVTNVGFRVFRNCKDLRYINLRKCTQFGPDTNESENLIFDGANPCELIVDNSLSTYNNGAPDGDIVTLLSIGGTVVYSTDKTAPPKPTINIKVSGSVYAELELSNIPTHVNNLGYAVVFVNDNFQEVYSIDKFYAKGFDKQTQTPPIKILLGDEFFNLSEYSNSVSTTTVLTDNIDFTEKNLGSTYLEYNFVNSTSLTITDIEVFCNGVSKGINNNYVFGLNENTANAIYLIANTTENIKLTSLQKTFNSLSFNVETSALVSYLKMEDNLIDSVGTNNGTPVDILYTDTLVNRGIKSNSNNSQVQLGVLPNLINDSTILFLMKADQFTSKANPFEFGSFGSWGSLNMFSDGTLYFYHTPHSGGSFVNPNTSPNKIPLNEWVIVSLKRDYTNGVITINFDEKEVMNFPTTETRAKSPSSQALLMKGYAGTLIGEMDEFMAFSKAITQDELLQIIGKLKKSESII